MIRNSFTNFVVAIQVGHRHLALRDSDLALFEKLVLPHEEVSKFSAWSTDFVVTFFYLLAKPRRDIQVVIGTTERPC